MSSLFSPTWKFKVSQNTLKENLEAVPRKRITLQKKNRAESPTIFENSPSAITGQAVHIDNSIEDSRVVDEALGMIEGVGAKLDQVLLKLDNLEDRVNVIHKDLTVIKEKMNELDSRVSVKEEKTKELQEVVKFVCEDTKELKVKAEKSYADAKEEVKKLKLHILNMEVYQRRESKIL